MKTQSRTIKCSCGERWRFTFPVGYRQTDGYCRNCHAHITLYITLYFDEVWSKFTGKRKSGRIRKKIIEQKQGGNLQMQETK